MNGRELTPVHEYMIECSNKELDRAIELTETNQRAKAQQHLREALGYMDRTPSWYKDEEFIKRYDRTYNILYRGYP